jgi:hypothetical protein
MNSKLATMDKKIPLLTFAKFVQSIFCELNNKY